MRIGIDARELCGTPTGVGRHLAGLLGAWDASPAAERHAFYIYTHETPAVALPANAIARVLPGAGGTLWEQTSLARAANHDGLDVFFAPGYTAPLSLKAPSVVLVHDLSFVSHPEWFRPREGLRRRLLTRWSSQRAAVVLTVSDAARAEIIAQYGLTPARVRRIHPGISKMTSRETPSDPREPLVLFVGSIFNRRHVPDLIEAFTLVWREHPEARMEIVGDNRTYPHQHLAAIVAAEGLQRVITLRAYVPDETLAGLYRRAGAFAFLSEYEGFGHPPLEALAAGVPGVMLDTPVARETCLDAALYVPCQTKGIAAALNSLLYDQETRAGILGAAPGVLARYSWANAAQQTLEAIEAADA